MVTLSDKENTFFLSFNSTTCNFPKAREVPSLWRNVLPALKSFLVTASQGIYGVVSNLKGEALIQTQVTVDEDREALEVQGSGRGFLALLSPGMHQLSFRLEGYAPKTVEISVKQGEMIRQNVVLDLAHDGGEMKYRTSSQIGMLLNQLSNNHPGKARVYPIGETVEKAPLLVMEVSDDLETSHLKPAIKVCK